MVIGIRCKDGKIVSAPITNIAMPLQQPQRQALRQTLFLHFFPEVADECREAGFRLIIVDDIQLHGLQVARSPCQTNRLQQGMQG